MLPSYPARALARLGRQAPPTQHATPSTGPVDALARFKDSTTRAGVGRAGRGMVWRRQDNLSP